MSKTVDDLIAIYDAARKGAPIMGDMRRAGISAVVQALRDEMQFGDWTAWHRLNEILGDAGEKVAEDPLPHLSEREKALFVAALKGDAGPATPPAAAPAPAVCEWRANEYEGAYSPGCETPAVWYSDGSETPQKEGYNFCPSCGKPIKFTEAK